MHSIDNSLAIIKPKRPYMKWANSLPDRDREYYAEYFKGDCLAVLIPRYMTQKEAKSYINAAWEHIFREILSGWTSEEFYPKAMSQQMFWKWFDVEFHFKVFSPFKDGRVDSKAE